MQRKFSILIALLTLLTFLQSQAQVANPRFEQKIQSLLSLSVPVCSPAQLKTELDSGKKILILDSRSEKEYKVSHLAEAKFVDFDNFDKKSVANIPRETEVVVYCSVGYRSEKTAEKLQKMGFINVRNLYGGIFEWVNDGNTVVDNAGKPTQKVHTFNKEWSEWLQKGTKVYD
ncbi:MAG: rhodanese-like domain-containing protein [Bacteroidia bacterium]|nr:rhodanese-like domain-containing protein [Bacteroidia bacterium]